MDLGRMGRVAVVMAASRGLGWVIATAFLDSMRASYVTGATVVVDGGMMVS